MTVSPLFRFIYSGTSPLGASYSPTACSSSDLHGACRLHVHYTTDVSQNQNRQFPSNCGIPRNIGLYLHVYISVRLVQRSHLTIQHQWNLQEHCHTRVYWCVLQPRPQHMRSHPSDPDDVRLHDLPTVPSEAVFGSQSQQLGDFSTQMRWARRGFRWALLDRLSTREMGRMDRPPRYDTTCLDFLGRVGAYCY